LFARRPAADPHLASPLEFPSKISRSGHTRPNHRRSPARCVLAQAWEENTVVPVIARARAMASELNFVRGRTCRRRKDKTEPGPRDRETGKTPLGAGTRVSWGDRVRR